MRHVQSDHRHIRTGMEHAVGGLRILDDVRFGGRIPTVAFLRQRSPHHYQPEPASDIRCRGKRRIDVGQRAGRHHHDVTTVEANRVDEESNAVRQSDRGVGTVLTIVVAAGIADGKRK